MPSRAIETFFGTPPAAGANFVFTFPGTSDDVYEILGVFTTLNTDANVANRRVILSIQNSASQDMQTHGSFLDQAATTLRRYTWSPRGMEGAAAVDNTISLALSSPLLVRGGDRLLITVINIQVGDTIANASSVRIQVARL